MPLQGFIDDSGGGKGERRVFVLAGFVNEAQWWAHITDEWDEWLAVHPRMPYLKMDQLGRLCLGWSQTQINEKLMGFVRIIKTKPLPLVTYISLDLDKFDKWKWKLVKPADDKFYLPALFTLLSVGHEQAKIRQEQCEVIFDEQKIYAPRLQLMYPGLRQFWCKRDASMSVLPHQPRFESDLDYPPLQAADMLAWIVRHAESREHHQYEWIGRELDELPRCDCIGEIQELSDMTDEDREKMASRTEFAEFERNFRMAKLGPRYLRYIKANYERQQRIREVRRNHEKVDSSSTRPAESGTRCREASETKKAED